MEMDIDQAQLMLQLRQMNIKDPAFVSMPSPAPSDASTSSSQGARGSNDSGFGSDKVIRTIGV